MNDKYFIVIRLLSIQRSSMFFTHISLILDANAEEK